MVRANRHWVAVYPAAYLGGDHTEWLYISYPGRARTAMLVFPPLFVFVFHRSTGANLSAPNVVGAKHIPSDGALGTQKSFMHFQSKGS